MTRRTVFELRKARERGHVLEGLAVALANIDEFIETIKASPTPPVAKAALMGKSWDSSMVREMLARVGERDAAAAATPTGPRACSPHFGLQADGLYRLSDDQAREILQMRLQRLTGLEQDKIIGEYREVMDADRRPARHPRDAGARDDDHRRRARGAEAGVRPDQARRAAQQIEHNALDLGTEDLITPTDMVVTLSHTGYIKSQPLVRVPRAAARRPRQAGDADQGRRLGRPALHRQHARLHPLLLQPRPRLLAQGLGSAAGLARLARPADRQHVPAAARREGQRRAAADRRFRSFPADHYVFMATAQGTVKKTSARRVQQPAQGRHHRRRPRRGDYLIGAALTDGKHDVMLFSDGGKAVRFDEDDVRAMGRDGARRARHDARATARA